MFIIGNKKEGFQVHFDSKDTQNFEVVGDLTRIDLSAEKAYELETRLEEALKGEA